MIFITCQLKALYINTITVNIDTWATSVTHSKYSLTQNNNYINSTDTSNTVATSPNEGQVFGDTTICCMKTRDAALPQLKGRINQIF